MSLKISFYEAFGGLKNIKGIRISPTPCCLEVEAIEELIVEIDRWVSWLGLKRCEKHPNHKNVFLIEFKTAEEAYWAYEVVKLP